MRTIIGAGPNARPETAEELQQFYDAANDKTSTYINGHWDDEQIETSSAPVEPTSTPVEEVISETPVPPTKKSTTRKSKKETE